MVVVGHEVEIVEFIIIEGSAVIIGLEGIRIEVDNRIIAEVEDREE